MTNYEEISPTARLASRVDAFWVSRQEPTGERWQRVLPDGCADIVYTRRNGRADLLFVGVMTSFKDFWQNAGTCSVGVRFRPAMWADIALANADMLVDQVVELEGLWDLAPRGFSELWTASITLM